MASSASLVFVHNDFTHTFKIFKVKGCATINTEGKSFHPLTAGDLDGLNKQTLQKFVSDCAHTLSSRLSRSDMVNHCLTNWKLLLENYGTMSHLRAPEAPAPPMTTEAQEESEEEAQEAEDKVNQESDPEVVENLIQLFDDEARLDQAYLDDPWDLDSEKIELVEVSMREPCNGREVFKCPFRPATTVLEFKKWFVQKTDEKQEGQMNKLVLDVSDFKLMSNYQELVDGQTLKSYAHYNKLEVFIHFKLKGGGKLVIKAEKLAVSKSKCATLAQKVSSSKETGLVKYDETYRVLVEDHGAISKMIEKMPVPNIDAVLNMFEEGEVKEFTMASKLARLVVPDIKEVENKKEQFASLYSALVQAFHHSMLSSYFNEKKGKVIFEAFKDELKTCKIEQETRAKYVLGSQSAMTD
mmetsp:Transcript_125794/g.298597  ORF Transcript_125794/g.298597 Transcript_125794/m.298597 type:complete len:411 (-) Transcript_125794:62-1294(-)